MLMFAILLGFCLVHQQDLSRVFVIVQVDKLVTRKIPRTKLGIHSELAVKTRVQFVSSTISINREVVCAVDEAHIYIRQLPAIPVVSVQDRNLHVAEKSWLCGIKSRWKETKRCEDVRRCASFTSPERIWFKKKFVPKSYFLQCTGPSTGGAK